MVKITLPDGTKKEYKDNITIGEVASNIGNRLREKALAGKASGVLVDLSFPIKEDISLSVITEDSEEDLKKIEEEMAKIIRDDIPFKRMELPRDLAIKKMEAIGQPFKVELIKDIVDDTVSFYTQGDFVDLCRGPHISQTS